MKTYELFPAAVGCEAALTFHTSLAPEQDFLPLTSEMFCNALLLLLACVVEQKKVHVENTESSTVQTYFTQGNNTFGYFMI